MTSLEIVRDILRDTLQLGSKADILNDSTPLLGAVVELDSMAVITVITALEDRLGILVEDEEISAEMFETVGSLAAFVNSKRDL